MFSLSIHVIARAKYIKSNVYVIISSSESMNANHSMKWWTPWPWRHPPTSSRSHSPHRNYGNIPRGIVRHNLWKSEHSLNKCGHRTLQDPKSSMKYRWRYWQRKSRVVLFLPWITMEDGSHHDCLSLLSLSPIQLNSLRLFLSLSLFHLPRCSISFACPPTSSSTPISISPFNDDRYADDGAPGGVANLSN